MKTSNCRSCDAEIIWVITESGRKMPVDAKPVGGYQLDGSNPERVEAVRVRTSHQSHFATCPNADQHRKPR